MGREKVFTVLAQVERWLWAALILLLPITSMPWVSRLARGAMVAPPSMMVLAFILAVGWVPFFLKRGTLSSISRPLLAFMLAALFSAAHSFFLEIPPFRFASLEGSLAEGLVTLAIGILFYLSITRWVNTENKVNEVYRWINWGGTVLLIWCLVQAVAWQMNLRWPEWLRTVQGFFSTGTLYAHRVTGFAYEPSWLNHMLNVLYLPCWLAATLTRTTAHASRIWKVSLENILLVGGVALLFLTRARIGMLAFLVMMGAILLYFSLQIARWLQKRVGGRVRKTLALIGFYALLVILALSVILGLGYRMSQTDYRMKTLFDIDTLRTKSFVEFAQPLGFAARIVYWQAGWEVFSLHPALGVGLGNAGFYFPEALSPYSWSLVEVRDYMYRFPSPPNIKSLWVRLLAETGMLGFVLFCTWYFLVWRISRHLFQSKNPLFRKAGIAGCLAILAFLMEGFSVDSFALPYLWISTGLSTAVFELSHLLESEETARNHEEIEAVKG